MRRAFLSLGSNIEPERNLARALAELARRFEVVAVSGVYRTAPVGDDDQPDFWNVAVELATDTPPLALQRELRAIESGLGRRRDPARRCGPRTVDLDLVLVADLAGRFGDLRLPSPLLETEAFVAVPLAAIAPDLRHPLSGVAIAELARVAAARAARPPELLRVELAR